MKQNRGSVLCGAGWTAIKLRRVDMRLLGKLMGVAIGSCAWAVALGQGYPTRPIQLILPYTAGSTTDASTRSMAKHMDARLNQSVLVENRPGANALVGALSVLRAPA